MNLRHTLHLVLLFCRALAEIYTPEARWAQATIVVNDMLFVYGGKTDSFNSYSYTSAPNNNDLLCLSLSQSFEAASPRWQLLNNSSNTSTFQGPALAWHTLSAFNTSDALLFGGEPSSNSQPPILDNADSAVLLDLSRLSRVAWYAQATSWAGQPMRRIYHASATAPSGVVYIIGGQKADGSGIGFSDHYAFNPRTLTFSLLPPENAPPEIYGHASVMSVDSKLIVFGGASKYSLLPLSAVWALDTSRDVPYWSQMQVSADSLPSPRRGFAATSIGQGKILIQGGSDANMQNNLDDGWILDTSKSPAVWMPVEQLSQIGPRRDHYAAYSNGFVVFGFGYLNSRPAPADILIFYLSGCTLVSSYTPPLSTASTIRTLSGEREIPTGTTTNLNQRTSALSSTTAVVNPTTTLGTPRDAEYKRRPIVAIIIGVILSILGAIAIAIVLYSRRQQRRGCGDLIIDDDASLCANSTIPAVTMYSGNHALSTGIWGNGFLGTAFGIAGRFSLVAKSKNVRGTYQRRDMLADEDMPDLGGWYSTRRRDGTGRSSLSLRSILGIRFRSREPSVYSRGSSRYLQEKTAPFSDGVSLMRDQEPETLGPVTDGHLHSRREINHLSASSHSYLDPFADPVDEKDDTHDTHEYDVANPVSRTPHELSTIRIVPLTTNGHLVGPLSEHMPNNGLPLNDLVSSSVDSSETPTEADTSLTTLQLTVEPSPSIKSIARVPISSLSTIIPASVPLVNVRRSDSWWSRFYRTSFLDRRSALRSSTKSQFLDPSFPPSLDPISERTARTPVAEFSAKQKGNDECPMFSNKLYKAGPGNSMTSLQTADTERIERMASAMDVAQHWHVRSLGTLRSVSSGLSTHTRRVSQEYGGLQTESGATPLVESPHLDDPSDALIHHSPPSTPYPPLPLRQRPLTEHPRPSALPSSPMPHDIASGTSETGLPTSLHYEFIDPVSSPSVAARVRMFESKLAQGEEQTLPINTRKCEERPSEKTQISVDYGFVPRQNLFIANPDHRNSRSSNS